jgi:hypothetical protein
MGKTSTNNFYSHFLDIRNKQSLNAIIEDNIAKKKIPTTNVFGFSIGFTPLQHASGANPNFYKMKTLKTQRKEFLKEKTIRPHWLINSYYHLTANHK